jgi:hypothetical protein
VTVCVSICVCVCVCVCVWCVRLWRNVCNSESEVFEEMRRSRMFGSFRASATVNKGTQRTTRRLANIGYHFYSVFKNRLFDRRHLSHCQIILCCGYRTLSSDVGASLENTQWWVIRNYQKTSIMNHVQMELSIHFFLFWERSLEKHSINLWVNILKTNEKRITEKIAYGLRIYYFLGK